VLRLASVTFRYPGAVRDSLHDLSLEVPAGTVTGLVGSAESGKSTLCLVAGGLAPRVVGGRLSGGVSLDGQDITDWPMHRVAEQVVTGLQDQTGQLSLIADRVLDEVAFGPANLGLPREVVLGRAEGCLRQLGIEALADRDPRRLSAGQGQLVGIAGLLAMGARYLVLDAPLEHLDARARGLVLEAVTAIAAAGTGVLITDQRVEAIGPICDRLVVLDGGEVTLAGPTHAVLADPALDALGVDGARRRLRAALAAAGQDPGLVDAVP
jgi:energy-coupling factor transport system ATP-binding protein